MNTNYYLVQQEPTQLYGYLRVANSTANGVSLFQWNETPEWRDGNGEYMPYPSMTMPQTEADLKALLDSGAYRLVDEYGDEARFEDLFGGGR